MTSSNASTTGQFSAEDIDRQVEIERKYAVPKGVRVPELDQLGAASPERFDILVADYYDTPDLALLNAHITLRRRTGGDDAGWHLKTPGTGDARHETRMPLKRGRRIPIALRAEVAEIVGEKPLLPVVRIRTERTTTELYGEDGSARAEIVADVVDATVLRSDVNVHEVWAEVEVELAASEPESTFGGIEELLGAAGIERSPSASKLGHILADVPPLERPDADSAAVEVALAALAEHFGRFQALEGAVANDEPDAVHQARVALRRMRSILQVYRKVFDRGDADRLRDELRWAGEKLGGPRDAEVIQSELIELLDSLEPEQLVGPVRARIQTELAERHDREFGKLLVAMASPRWDSVFASATEFIVEVPATSAGRRPARVTLDRLAGESVAKTAQRNKAAKKHPEALEGWHEVRKGAKGARYAHEVLAGIGSKGAERRREKWKKVTSAFGEVQDCVILQEQLGTFESAARRTDEPVDTYVLLRAKLGEKRDAALLRGRTLLAEVLDD
ncbi:CYTH and CHAD domain-containing protein [Gulosibacter molinativorax]|uniref:CHAD domain-containing protein n=1 Tax=Gulosibacter molinativorax TaxID=256821 RepID=A0ABT7C6Q3_9MICO|nr:CYTH and CHAD domain-containing protein [Gulosibacter molinativorax]MDJ1370351.1 CHAD domain-containing protein [Gulosibacter molinativorax]QUY61264.1 Hypotetical protein [Gulosibacter molinativorax]